ncbi:hypothetical protein N9L68_05540 [bacterium]|nr:hypothetical protein [bacterium]
MQVGLVFISSLFDVVVYWTEVVIVVLEVTHKLTMVNLVRHYLNKTAASYVGKNVLEWVDNLGIDNVVFLMRIRQHRIIKTRAQVAPRYHSQSRGSVKSYIKLAQGRLGRLRLHVEGSCRRRVSRLKLSNPLDAETSRLHVKSAPQETVASDGKGRPR